MTKNCKIIDSVGTIGKSEEVGLDTLRELSFAPLVWFQ